ncbi:fibrinogen alpha chain isoform X6 [Ctenopharyngodon idella]|uniref:fibrinogen alpha chain isoform X6 n=1 Tax=Ctenopharyngodon idella TaxID=7959 RepID=UPI00222E7E5A|nr:fibrinogen alpha chain isoform X6 [Ctenopharyngodon idella]
MKLTHSFFCLFVVVSSALSEDVIVDPRGVRPVQHGYKAQDTCQTKEWPMCTDDDWGSRCPSGCRVQGLMDKADHDIHTKITKISSLLDEGKKLYRSADQVSKTTYSYLRERLTSSSGNDNRYASLADQLRQRITDIKIKIDRQLRLLDALKSQVKDQVIVMQRLEVDIDIKLRTCKGSCASYSEFTVDKESYVTLDKQMDHLNTIRVQSVETVSSLGIMKSRPLKDVVLPSIFKSGTGKAEQKQLLFGDVGQMQLTLEAEGSTAESAATVSKFPTSGTGSTSSSTSHASSSSTSTSTSTVKQCTKSVRTVVTHTKDGPVTKTEVSASGPGCEDLEKLGISDSEFLTAAKDRKELKRDGVKITVTGGDEKSVTSFTHGTDDLGGFGGDFFKRHGSDTQELSSSSSSTKTVVSDGSKSYSKTTLSREPIFGDDLGAFMRGDVEEDLPDIHARSLKSKDDRKAGLVGRDCVEILQKHANGSPSGLFKIKPAGSEEVVEVYCDQGTGMGAGFWFSSGRMGLLTSIALGRSIKMVFGQVDQQGKGEVWIGNNYLHLLTQTESLLRVELQDWHGNKAYA